MFKPIIWHGTIKFVEGDHLMNKYPGIGHWFMFTHYNFVYFVEIVNSEEQLYQSYLHTEVFF